MDQPDDNTDDAHAAVLPSNSVVPLSESHLVQHSLADIDEELAARAARAYIEAFSASEVAITRGLMTYFVSVFALGFFATPVAFFLLIPHAWFPLGAMALVSYRRRGTFRRLGAHGLDARAARELYAVLDRTAPNIIRDPKASLRLRLTPAPGDLARVELVRDALLARRDAARLPRTWWERLLFPRY